MSSVKYLEKLGACPAALEWARGHGGSLAELWRDCPRGDWLLWYAGKVRVRREDLVRAAAGCAELALPYAGTERGVCEAAIAAARAWADAPGVGTGRVVERAANAANAAAARVAARAAAYAAMYAADAARAADAAYTAGAAAGAAARAVARAAADAARAADAVAYAAGAAGAAAGDEMHKRCADVARSHVPFREVGS